MWQLEISFDKCMHICFGTSVFEFLYSFSNYVIKKCQDVIDLGISISHDLKFSLYFESIAKESFSSSCIDTQMF